MALEELEKLAKDAIGQIVENLEEGIETKKIVID